MFQTSELRDIRIEEKEEANTTTVRKQTKANEGTMRPEIKPGARARRSPELRFARGRSDTSEEENEGVEDEAIYSFPLAPQCDGSKRNSKLRPLPDLRFEQSYRNSIAGADTVGGIIAITVRDQVILPLLQGTLWSLALLGWAHWNRVAQVSGSSLGNKLKGWWYKSKSWKSEALRSKSANAELAAIVGDS